MRRWSSSGSTACPDASSRTAVAESGPRVTRRTPRAPVSVRARVEAHASRRARRRGTCPEQATATLPAVSPAAQEVERGLVGPVQVLEDEHARTSELAEERRKQLVRPGGVVDQPLEVAPHRRGHVCDRPERARREERVAPAPQHLDAGRVGERPREGRLPRPGLATDEHHRAAARKPVLQHREGLLPLEQVGEDRRRHHPESAAGGTPVQVGDAPTRLPPCRAASTSRSPTRRQSKRRSRSSARASASPSTSRTRWWRRRRTPRAPPRSRTRTRPRSRSSRSIRPSPWTSTRRCTSSGATAGTASGTRSPTWLRSSSPAARWTWRRTRAARRSTRRTPMRASIRRPCPREPRACCPARSAPPSCGQWTSTRRPRASPWKSDARVSAAAASSTTPACSGRSTTARRTRRSRSCPRSAGSGSSGRRGSAVSTCQSRTRRSSSWTAHTG